MDEREAREKHEQNLLALVGSGARRDPNVIHMAQRAAHDLYLRDERIRQLERRLAEERELDATMVRTDLLSDKEIMAIIRPYDALAWMVGDTLITALSPKQVCELIVSAGHSFHEQGITVRSR